MTRENGAQKKTVVENNLSALRVTDLVLAEYLMLKIVLLIESKPCVVQRAEKIHATECREHYSGYSIRTAAQGLMCFIKEGGKIWMN